MQLTFIHALLGLGLVGVSSAGPRGGHSSYHSLGKRALTPDNTCGILGAGNGNNYTCDPNAVQGGGCCSASGYCGATDGYCGSGCQPDFGICAGSESVPLDPNMCGAANANNICLDGLCCSSAGYCGNTTDYCTGGCQKNFGDCTTTIDGDGDGTCGPAFGEAKCPTGQCCSPSGYCGTTSDYCQDPSCQYSYGICDSTSTPTGPSTLGDPRPLLGAVSYDDDIYDCVAPKAIALTYDDGPYLYTSELLDTLKSYGFRATFFITGNNLGKGAIDITAPYPSIIQRMIDEGHQVASHTWSHYSLSNITSAMRIQQMIKNERAFANIIGKYPTYMRPPYSQCDASSGCQADMKALGYHRVYFDFDTQDYLNPLPSQIQASKDIVQALLAVPGTTDYLSIQHDIVQQSVTNLTSYYFDLIKAKGWKGVTAGECLQDPITNWYRTPGGAVLQSTSTSTSTSVVAGAKGTSSATSKTSTTSSKGPTTTSQSSTSSSKTTPTTTAPSTSFVVPTAAPTCIVKAGNFCGTINPFGDKKGCQMSAANCYLQAAQCPNQAASAHKNGKATKADLAQCATYLSDCIKLTTYCSKCGFVCSSTKAGLSK